jgi:hypothetical protein
VVTGLLGIGEEVRPFARLRNLLPTAAALVLLGIAAIPVVYWPSRTPPIPGPPNFSEQQTALVPLTAELDVRVWKKADTSKGLLLGTAGALPLRAGDWMRVEAQSNRPAYLYVIYLDARGEASPLFPWRQYDWVNRPAEEKRTRLHLPEDPLKDAAPLEAGPSGIEAVLLLARDEPLGDAEAAVSGGCFRTSRRQRNSTRCSGRCGWAGRCALVTIRTEHGRITTSRERWPTRSSGYGVW